MAKQGLLGHVRLNVNFGKTDVVALDRYVILSSSSVGLKIVKTPTLSNDGAEKKAKHVWLSFLSVMIYFCNALTVPRL